MADYFAGQITIGGPIRHKVVTRLVETILSTTHASLTGYGEAPPTAEELKAALEQGPTVTLYDEQARYGEFDELEAFLVRHRIHFDRHSDSRYEYDSENVYYRGQGQPLVAPATQGGQRLLRVEDVRQVLQRRTWPAERKLQALRQLVEPPQAAPLAPVRLVD